MTNHEICRFVNSKDIRKHLEDINYTFTTAEAAWLVNQCRDATLKEKEDAWKKIIETMPDQSIDSVHFDKPYESIHKVISDYIKMKKRIYEMFLMETSTSFYQYTLVYEDRYKEYDQSLLYSSYEKCFHDMSQVLSEAEKDITGEIRWSEIGCFYQITTHYNHDVQIMDVEIPGNGYGVLDNDLLIFFDCLWFHFPAPFKKGDIIYDPLRPSGHVICNGPLVMTGCTPMWFEEDGRSHADTTDMGVSGYFQSEDGSLYQDNTGNYMDFEYFPSEKLTGKKRILKALSNLIKEEIDLELFIKAYHLIILEETRNDFMPRGWFTDEGMKLAGIWEDKEPS